MLILSEISGVHNIFVRIANANLLLSENDIIHSPIKLNEIINSNTSSVDGEYLEFNISANSLSQADLIPELFASALMMIKLETLELNGIGTLIARNGTRYKYLFNEK